MDPLQATTLTNGQTVLDSEAIQLFAERLRGPLLHPGDEGYDDARTVWNGMIDREPVPREPEHPAHNGVGIARKRLF